MINTFALTQQLVSPCRSCDNHTADKNICMQDCERLGQFRGYLNAYNAFTIGAFTQARVGEHCITR